MNFSERYLEIVRRDFAGLNLTRILEPAEFELKQYHDSIEPYLQVESFRRSIEQSKYCVDVGFGGGFPILPLASLLPNVQFIGLEARGKKATAVNAIARSLGLGNVQCFHKRLETILFDRDCTVTFKAVGKIPEFLEMFHVEQKTEVFFYKGPGVFEQENLKSIDEKRWEQIVQERVLLEGVEARYLLGYRSKKVPRGTNKDKLLVKLSSLI